MKYEQDDGLDANRGRQRQSSQSRSGSPGRNGGQRGMQSGFREGNRSAGGFSGQWSQDNDAGYRGGRSSRDDERYGDDYNPSRNR